MKPATTEGSTAEAWGGLGLSCGGQAVSGAALGWSAGTDTEGYV